MPLWRMQVSFGADSAFPRDRLVITPHFNDTLPGSDPTGLANDLADALVTWCATPAREIRVVVYDAQGTPPVYPVADVIRNAGLIPGSTGVRETACCLSFYAERNLPRQRGRLFVPIVAFAGSQGAVRPTLSTQEKIAELVPIFTGLGGTDVDWCVYSRLDNQPRSVSHWWIDNEWDTIRSRGLRPDSRLAGTVSE